MNTASNILHDAVVIRAAGAHRRFAQDLVGLVKDDYQSAAADSVDIHPVEDIPQMLPAGPAFAGHPAEVDDADQPRIFL